MLNPTRDRQKKKKKHPGAAKERTKEREKGTIESESMGEREKDDSWEEKDDSAY
jgi:hypothetical protein